MTPSTFHTQPPMPAVFAKHSCDPACLLVTPPPSNTPITPGGIYDTKYLFHPPSQALM